MSIKYIAGISIWLFLAHLLARSAMKMMNEFIRTLPQLRNDINVYRESTAWLTTVRHCSEKLLTLNRNSNLPYFSFKVSKSEITSKLYMYALKQF